MTMAHVHDVPAVEPDLATMGPSLGNRAEDAPSASREGDELRQRLLNLILRNEARRKAQPR